MITTAAVPVGSDHTETDGILLDQYLYCKKTEHELDNNYRRDYRDDHRLHVDGLDPADEESRMVDSRLSKGNTGGIFQDTRTGAFGVFLQDGVDQKGLRTTIGLGGNVGADEMGGGL